jgi:hypothetical protein
MESRRVTGKSPANIAKHMKGIDFPADRNQVVNKARDNGAPQEVLDVLEKIPEKSYDNMADLMEGVGKVE